MKPTPQRSVAWWLGAIVITAAVVLLSTLLSNVRRDKPQFDIFDEGAHYDYVVALQSHHVPAFGDTLRQSTMLLNDCLGSDVAAPRDCSQHPRNYHNYAAGGFSYEAQQPPLAYLPYMLTTDSHSPPAQDMVQAREGGVIWTAAGALLLLLFAGFAGLPLLGLTLLLSASLLNPTHVHAAATVNNDAAAVAAGALALLLSTVLRHRGPLWLRLGAGVMAGLVIGLLKGLFVLAPFAIVVAVVLLDRPWKERLQGWKGFARRNACVLAMLLASLAAYVGWVVLQMVRARVKPGVVLQALLGASTTNHPRPTSMLDGLEYVLGLFNPSSPSSLHAIWNIAFFAVVIGVLLVKPWNGRLAAARSLSAGALLALVALSVGWPILVFLQGHFDYAAAGRYALPVMPVLALAAAKAASRWGLAVLGVGFPLAATVLQLRTGKY